VNICPKAVHEAMKADESVWQSLPAIAPQDDGEGGWLAQRNCPCGATLVREERGPLDAYPTPSLGGAL
jgi:hypothetical protein